MKAREKSGEGRNCIDSGEKGERVRAREGGREGV